MRRILCVFVAAAVLVAAAQSFAQDDAARRYPNRAVKIIVSAPPGGGLDIAARVIADRLTKMWGQPFVVENRAGASGNPGAEAVAQAEPDGYTLLAAQPGPLTTSVVIKVKMLAVTTAARIASVPEVPTMEEAGVKDFRSDSWNALAAPPKTPAAIVAKLNDAINAVLKERDTAEHLRSMNMTPVGGAPDAAKIFIKQEAERWGEVIRAAKISLD